MDPSCDDLVFIFFLTKLINSRKEQLPYKIEIFMDSILTRTYYKKGNQKE
jgi:hypothetical protein